MTWGEILKQSGGKSSGNNHHIKVDDCRKDAKDRSSELRVPVDDLFSL
jgi:hypothetical protein